MAGRKSTQALENHAGLQASPLSEELPPGYKMTELGPLPEEWRVVPLRLLGQISAGGSAPQGSHYFGGTHPFVRVQHLDEDGYEVRRWDLITDEAVQRYRLRLFPPGTIVFPKSGASIRLEKRAILARPSYLVSHLCAIIPNYDIVDGDFLFFALKWIPLAAEKTEGYPTLSLTEIGQRLVPLPPLPEQRAIADVLRTVQRAKEATERVIAALRELKKSLMSYLFTYGPVPVDQADQVALKETQIGPVPEEWEVVRLGEVVTLISDAVQPSHIAVERYVGLEHIEPGSIRIRKWGYPSEVRSLKITFRAGDVLYGKLRPYLDKAALAEWEGICSTDILVLRAQKGLEPEFLAYLAHTPIFLEYATATMTGVNHPRTSWKALQQLQITLPPLSEQRAIAEILRAVDRKIEAEEARQRALEALFRTLLHDLMTARLRLPPAFIARFAEDAP